MLSSQRLAHLFTAFAFVVAAKAQTVWPNLPLLTDITSPLAWGGTLPGSTDVIQFSAATGTLTVGTTTSSSLFVNGIQFTSGQASFTLAGPGTITVGSSGISNVATSALTVSAPLKFLTTAPTITNSGNLTISGLITNNVAPLGLTISNNGNMTLSGGLANNGTLGVFFSGSGGTATVSGAITGTGAVGVDGTGTWILSAANTYTGGTTVKGGTLNALASGALPAGKDITVAASTPSASPVLTLTESAQSIGNLTLGGISGTSAMVSLTTNATLTLGGTVTYDATNNPNGASISAGTVVMGANQLFSIGGNGSGSSGLFITSALTGATSNLIKTGTGRLVLGGNNTYGGTTTINDGRLQLGSSTALVSGGAVLIDAQAVSTSTTDHTATFDLGGQAATVGTLTLKGVANSSNKVDLGPDGTLTFSALRYDATNNPAGASIFNGSITLGASSPTITVDKSTNAGGQDLTISSPIHGAVGLTKAGAGTLVLTGDNDYAGDTVISGGTLQLGNFGYYGTVSGNIVDNAALVFSHNDTLSFGGVISGTGNVTVNGSLNLSGANTYSGGTMVNGDLTVRNTSGSGTGSGTLTIGSSGTLSVGDGESSGFVSGSIINNGAVYFKSPAGLTYSGQISGTGQLWKYSNGTVTLTSANTYTGETDIAAGTLKLTSSVNVLPVQTGLNVWEGATLDVASNQTLQNLSYTQGTIMVEPGVTLTLSNVGGQSIGGIVSGNETGSGTLIINAGSGNLTFDGANQLTGQTIVTGGTLVTYRDGRLPANGTLVIKPASGGSAVVDISDTSQTVGALTFGGAGASAGGQGTLSIDGGQLAVNGDITFDAANNPAGARLAGSGTVFLGTTAHAIVVGDSTNATFDLTIEPSLQGTGALTKTGAGTLLLSGDSAGFSGTVTLANGTLLIGDAAFVLGTGPLALQSGTVFGATATSVNLVNATTLSDNITLGLSSYKTDLVFAGAVTVPSAATVHVKNDRVTFSGGMTGTNSVLTFDGGGTVVLNSAINNVSDIVSNGSPVIVASASALAGSGHVLLQAGTGSTSTTNAGYVGVGSLDGVAPSVGSVIGRIDTGHFNGTFGFDTLTEDVNAATFGSSTDPLNFSSFNPSLTLGSSTYAILAGTITPPTGATAYAFGNGGGVLAVQSNLTGNLGLSVASSTAFSDNALGVILQGANTFTGPVTVTNSALVLDSAGALPAGRTVSLGAAGYLGATENYGLLATAQLASYTATSVLGYDSAGYVSQRLNPPSSFGPSSLPTRLVTSAVDLRSLSPIYLGTVTNVTFGAPVYAPQGGNLALVSAGSGNLTITSSIGATNATQVTIGSTQLSSSDGSVILKGKNTYAGGTTLLAGRTEIDVSSRGSGSSVTAGPLGTGTVTVPAAAANPILASGSYTGNITLGNTLALGSALQVGDVNGLVSSYISEIDVNTLSILSSLPQFVLSGPITDLDASHHGAIELYGSTLLTGANTFSGGIDWHPGILEVGNGSALGTGTLTLNGASATTTEPAKFVLKNDGALTLANNLVVGPATVAQQLFVSGTGALTLGSTSTTIALNGPGLVVSPTNYPVYFAGNVTGTGSLTVNGTNALILSGTNNTYAGGTIAEEGALIFSSLSSLPATGNLSFGSEGNGYIGIASTTGLSGTNLQTLFINRFDTSGDGTIGFDSPTAGPVNTFSGNIDLTRFESAPALGSATQAILSGTILTSGDYNFGGGGGVLTVASALTNIDSEAGSNLYVYSPSLAPLTLKLSGTNAYTGDTYVHNSALIFTTPTSLSTGTNFHLGSGGYIGYTLAANANGTDSAIVDFLGRFTALGAGYLPTSGYIGFDSTGVTLNGLDVSSLGSGAFGLATTSNLTLAGTYTVAANQSVYRFAGYKGGALTVASSLTDGSSTPRIVWIGDGTVPATFGTPTDPTAPYSSVTLSGSNTYTGGTRLNAGNLYVGSDTALGSGTLIVVGGVGNAALGQRPGLLASGGTRTLSNPIAIYSDLDIGGGLNLELDGIVSGSGELYKVGSGTLTLAANNSFTGGVYVQAGTVVFNTGTSLGTGSLEFGIQPATATFLDSGTINGISGDSSSDVINFTAGKSMTINQTFNATFPGSIQGAAAGLNFTGNSTLTLSGASSFSGPVTISSGAIVIAANATALGSTSNPVTVNGGRLGVASGVTVSNPLTLASGRLVGNGTFKATGIGFTIGNGMTIAPGIGGVGALNFDGSLLSTSALILANSGAYRWQLTDATATSGGWDVVTVTGNVSVTATSIAPFNFKLTTLNADGSSGYAANFDPTQSYSWTILSVTNGTITGFSNSGQFSIDTSSFQNSIGTGTFSLSLTNGGTALALNFSPVPEPATYALIGGGLIVLGGLAWRRRRQLRMS